MDTNEEIMVNDETVETEEIESTGLGNGAKIGIGVGLTVLLGAIAYKVGKPALKKIKAKHKKRKLDKAAASDIDDDETEVDTSND